jgi:hypothetical protein
VSRPPAPKFEWARFNLRVWREESETFRHLSPDDRRLAGALYMACSAEGPIPDVPLAIAAAAWEDDTARVPEIREKMPSFAFRLVGGMWVNSNSMKLYDKARSTSLRRAEAGAKGGASANAQAIASASTSPSPSYSPSVVEEAKEALVTVQEPTVLQKPSSLRTVGKVGRQESLVLFEPPIEAEVIRPVKPRRNTAFDLALLYFRARFERLKKTDEPYIQPPDATIGKAAVMIQRALDQGKEPMLLTSLPALIEKDEYVGSNPYSLLEDGESRRTAKEGHTLAATDHAAVIGAKLQGLVITQRQASILDLIGTLEWAKSRGVKLKATYKREGA